MIRRTRLALVAPALSLALLGSACGGDDDGSTPDPTTGPTVPAGAAGDGDTRVDEALDELGLERIGRALESTLDASRYEVDGDTLHLYLTSESNPRGQIACMTAKGTVGDRGTVVIHDDGEEITCG